VAIRRSNDRALAALSPSPQATIYAAPTTIPSISPTPNGVLLASLFFGVLGLGICLIIAVIEKDSRLATTPPTLPTPAVTTLSVSQLQFPTASLKDLRHGVIPHYYHLDDFFPNKGEIVIWAFHGVRHYRVKNSVRTGRSKRGSECASSKRVWIHSGASHGHKLQYSAVDSEIGTLVFTNSALCFVGDNSVRIAFSHILALNTYSDGIGLHTDYAHNSKQIFGDMHTDNVAFLKKALSLLHKNSL
jgi:hypothetical protein